MQPHRPPPFHAASSYPGSAAAQAVAAALSNPYAAAQQAQYAYPQASHYAQAYAQYYNNGAGPSSVTAEGYTISSTYVPGTQYAGAHHHASRAHSGGHRQQGGFHGGGGGGGGGGGAGWYQAGTNRCSKPGCAFTGSKKSVETHMMDRHLIFPPGWEHRRRKNDWDADPSLKGCAVPPPLFRTLPVPTAR